jgi:hypothetical protein
MDFYVSIPSLHDRKEVPPRIWTCLKAEFAPPPQVFLGSMYDDEDDIQVPNIVADQEQSGFL